MVFLKRIAARVGHEEMSLVVSYALRLVSHFTGSDNLERMDVNLGHIPLCKHFVAIDGATLMTIGRYINISAVGGEFAVVRHIFCLGHTLPIG